MPDEILFEEKQYLGYNPLSLFRRLFLSLFCFALYWWKIHNDRNGDLFFWLGIGILVVSLVMRYILHMRIIVSPASIQLSGLWTTRKVIISLHDIVKIERREYSHLHFNNPVFNLHLKGTIRFYTGGNEAIELTNREGIVYRIGTQRPLELEQVLQKLIASDSRQ